MKDLPKIIPVFPLSNFIIFPKTAVPLNIFEPRYIDMVNDAMKSNKFIGMIQPKTAKNTITDISNFKKELKKIKNQGYAFDDEEWFDGMAGISVPIFNSKSELCFCLSTHTAKSRKDIN